MADVYLTTNAPHGATDVILRTSAISGTARARGEARHAVTRETDNRFDKQYGAIVWHVTIDGQGHIETEGHLTLDLETHATECTGDLHLRVSGTSELAATTDMRVRVEPDPGVVTAAGTRTLTLSADLRHITDPPDLWAVLDLVELIP